MAKIIQIKINNEDLIKLIERSKENRLKLASYCRMVLTKNLNSEVKN